MTGGTARTTVMLKIDDAVCRACGRCLAGEACRGNAFVRFSRGESPFIDTSKCWGCLICMPACPFGAVVQHLYGDAS